MRMPLRTARCGHRRIPIVVKREKGTPKQSNHRHGNCTNRNLGKVFQSGSEMDDIRKTAITDHVRQETQSFGSALRHFRVIQNTHTKKTISTAATNVTRAL